MTATVIHDRYLVIETIFLCQFLFIFIGEVFILLIQVFKLIIIEDIETKNGALFYFRFYHNALVL